MKERIYNSDNVKILVGGCIKKARDDLNISRKKLCDLLNQQEPDMSELQPDTLKQWELGVNQINIAFTTCGIATPSMPCKLGTA